MQLSKETKVILDAMAAVGNIVEIVDSEGVYIYCSSNSNFANMGPNEMLGKNVKDIYGLTDDTSKVMQVIRTGLPLRDYLMSFRSIATGKKHLWLYSAYPLVVDGNLLGAITIYKPFSNVKGLVDEYEGASKKKSDYPASVRTRSFVTFDDIIYVSENMAEAIELGKKVAKSNASVLLIGETGTGKELFASSIHSSSAKSDKPFVVINCAAIPDTLLESILFGTAKGAYTGAVEKKGLFEQSAEGTIFLDEIQTLSPEMQAKILRVLEYKVVRRVGGDKEVEVNPRIITSMNVNPYDYIRTGKMKPDLFYRIAVVTINIPPLRERLKDIPLLVNHFIRSANKNTGHHVEKCSDEVMQRLSIFKWPGNVRELQHVIEHASIVMDECETCIQMHHLPLIVKNDTSSGTSIESDCGKIDGVCIEVADKLNLDYKTAYSYALDKFKTEFNKYYIRHALENTNNNISKTAQNIEITRQHLHKLLKMYDIR